eukprot:PITA_20619
MSNYEREASIRPPIFDGTNFVYWKVRVTAYLQYLGTEVWDIIDTGYTFPSATPTDPAEKKKYETNAKAVNTLLGCLSQSEFVKVKRAKLQTLRIQYENLKMYNDESVANYFLRVDEIVNCMKNLGEEIKEVVVVEKVLRSLSSRFESKVSAIEEKENLQNLKMSQLHGILTAYEMRKGGPSDMRVAAFKASGKGEYYESGHVDEDERGNNYKLLMDFEDDDYMDAIDVDGFYEEISRLKTCLEENNVIIDTLQFQLDEKENFLEKLECEIVGLRKEIEKTKALNLKFFKGSETLDEFINVHHSPLIKTGLGYNGEISQASTSKSYLDAARRNEKKPNEDHQEQVSADKEQASSTRTWRIKEPQPERCGIAFYVEGQENLCYIDSGCSKHMTGDKEKLESYTALEKGKKASFGNDTPTAIKGKGTAQLKEKVKAGNVLYVDGLKHNLLSVSHMCDQGIEVIFRSNGCSVCDLDTGKTVIKGRRTPNNIYIFEEGQEQCYLSKDDEHWLWNRRLGHLSFSQIRKACKYQAVRGLLDIKIPDNTICKSCQFGKKTRTNFPEKEGLANSPLELVHTDVCGPFRKRSPRGEEYFILFIDDFSRMVWLGLMKHKDEAFEKFKYFKALAENESDHKIKCLRSDIGGEFTSNEFFNFCEEHGIRREFSTARTPQQNGVVERMNITVQQMARAMLDESGTPATFWGEAAFATVVILNKTNVRVNNTQTPHELWYGETPSVKHFKIFGSKCYIKNNDEHLGKLEPRADEGILLGYSPHNKAYKCYNKRLGRIVDNIDVVVDEKGNIPRQINYENIKEDEEYSLNQIEDEEEPQKAPKE